MNKIFSLLFTEIVLILKSPVLLFPSFEVFRAPSSSRKGKGPKFISQLKKILSVALTIITFTLVPILALTIITSRTAAFGFQSFVVVSGSMAPNLPVGSIVYTQKGSQIGIGDVITFKKKGVNVTHRVIDVTDENGNSISPLISPIPGAPNPAQIFYKTKGDANKSIDADLIPAEDVIGKAFVNMPTIGKISGYLKTLPGFLILIIGPTLFFVALELWNIKREIEKQTERKILERLRIS